MTAGGADSVVVAVPEVSLVGVVVGRLGALSPPAVEPPPALVARVDPGAPGAAASTSEGAPGMVSEFTVALTVLEVPAAAAAEPAVELVIAPVALKALAPEALPAAVAASPCVGTAACPVST